MVQTVIHIIEMIFASVLYLKIISDIQKLLLNYSGKIKWLKFLKILCIMSGMLCSLYRDKVQTHLAYFVISVVLFYMLIFIIQLVCSTVSKIRGAYITIVYLTIDSIVQSLVFILLDLIGTVYDDSSVAGLSSVLFGCICLLAIRKADLSANRIRNSVNLLSKKIYVLILFALFFIANLTGNLSVESYDSVFGNRANSILTALSILLFVIIIINFIFKSISKEYYENLSYLMEKTVKHQLKHYEKIIELNEELREFRHDYKNHMICLQALLESKAYEQAEEYIQEITMQKVIENKNFFTGNRIADAIISDKNEIAEKNGCTIKYSGCISDMIAPSDLCTILSNALDNAIEACIRMDTDNILSIEIDCAVLQAIQIIQIKNPNNMDTTMTSKPDKNNHGFGLLNIRTTVEKLDGQMKIPQKIPEFILELEFPIKD